LGNGDLMLEQYLPFVALIVFGNIENLVLSSQGVVAGVNPLKLAIASFFCVGMWLVIGTFGTQMLIQYVDFIDFIGGLAIFILGAQAMITSIRGE
jgi:putative Mn2+ efflux pump MntP